MTENLKKFLERACAEGGELLEKLNKAGKEEIIALAAEMGIALTEADFAPPADEGEVSVDEAAAVAGGFHDPICRCAQTGVGKQPDIPQKCELYGFNFDECTYSGCFCPSEGSGNYNPFYGT